MSWVSIIFNCAFIMLFTPLLSGADKKGIAVAPKMVKEIRLTLEQAMQEAAKRIATSINLKSKILHSDLSDRIKKVQLAEQNKIIAHTKQELIKLADNAMAIADEADKQASHLTQFINKAQSFASLIISPFKAGYGSDQEKLLARAIIDELENLKITEYDPYVIKELDKAIYEQKLISGDEMALQKKLLIGAIVAAAALAGVILTGRYLSALETPSAAPEILAIPVLQPTVTQISPEVSTAQDPLVAVLELNNQLKQAEHEVEVVFKQNPEMFESALDKEIGLYQELVVKEQDLNNQLQTISDLDIENKKKEIDELLIKIKQAEAIEHQSDVNKTLTKVLKEYKKGKATKEELDQAIENCEKSEEYKQARNFENEIAAVLKQSSGLTTSLTPELHNLGRIIELRNKYLKKKGYYGYYSVQDFFEDSKAMSNEYPIHYSAEQLKDIVELDRKYQQSVEAISKIQREEWSAGFEYRLGSGQPEYDYFQQKCEDWESGLISEEEKNKAEKIMTNSDEWKQYEAAKQKTTEAKRQSEEILKELVNALKTNGFQGHAKDN